MKLYITFYMWAQALLIQTTGEAFSSYVENLSKFSNGVLFLISTGLFLLNFNKIKSTYHSRKFANVLFYLSLLLVVGPMMMILVLGRYTELGEIVRLFSWLIIIPLSSIAFSTAEDLQYLKKSFYGVFAIVFIGLVYANITKLGTSAYDLGVFYLGGIQNEATASLCLGMIGLSMALPFVKGGQVRISKLSVVVAIVCFLLIVAVLKRSTIIAFPIALYGMFYFLATSKSNIFSKKYFFSITLISTALLVILSAYIILQNPELIDARTKDFTKYEETGDASYLGAGRLYLANLYLDMFVEGEVINMLVGQFPLSRDTIDYGGYLATNNNHPHNDFIDITLRGGLISLVILYYLLFSVLKIAVRQYRSSKSNDITIYMSCVIIGVFLFYITQAFVGTLFRLQAMTYFAVLLGTFLGISSNKNNRLTGATDVGTKKTVKEVASGYKCLHLKK